MHAGTSIIPEYTDAQEYRKYTGIYDAVCFYVAPSSCSVSCGLAQQSKLLRSNTSTRTSCERRIQRNYRWTLQPITAKSPSQPKKKRIITTKHMAAYSSFRIPAATAVRIEKNNNRSDLCRETSFTPPSHLPSQSLPRQAGDSRRTPQIKNREVE